MPLGLARTQSSQLLVPLGLARTRPFQLLVILEQNPRDERRPSPGWEKSLIVVQKKQDDPTCIVGSRAAARESRKRSGKTEPA